MKCRMVVAGVILILVLGFILPATTPVQAQEDCPWSYLIDYSLDSSFAENTVAMTDSNSTWDGTKWVYGDQGSPDEGGNYYRSTNLGFESSYTGFVTQIVVTFDLTKGTYFTGEINSLGFLLATAGDPELINKTADEVTDGDDQEETWTGDAEFAPDNWQVRIDAGRWHTSGGSPSGSSAIRSLYFEGYGTNIFTGLSGCYENLIRPLSAADESPVFGTFNNTSAFEVAAFLDEPTERYYPLHAGFSPYAVTAVGRRAGMPVHSAAGGTVEHVTPLEYSDCGTGFASNDETTWFTIDGTPPCLTSFFQTDELGSFVSGAVPIANAYRVVINSGGLTLVYVVANAPDYVSEGDTVSGGCVIGLTLGVEEFLSVDIGVTVWGIFGSAHELTSDDLLAGFTVVTAYETTLDDPFQNLLNQLTEYPDNDHPCNADPQVSECMGSNPRFLNNGEGWLVKGGTGAYFQIGGGVIINPGAEVYAAFLLDPETEYDVTVGGIDIATSLGTALQVRIGTSKEIFSLSPGDPEDGIVVLDDATPETPIADGVYEVGLKVTGSDPVFVEYACITDATNTPQVPTACYFANHSFDFDSSGWTAGASIQFPGDGTANMIDDADGTLEQAYNLLAGDYTLSARVRAYYNGDGSVPSLPDGDIDLHYDMGDGEETLGSLVFTTFDPGLQVLTTTFNLADTESGDITFYLDINDGSEELLGLTIDRLCLTKDGGYTGGGGVPPPFNPSCEIVANPNTTDVATWIAWLWAQLDRFFQCDLMILLNDLYVQVVNGIQTMLRFSRYMVIVAQRQASWVGSDMIPWLGGYLNNIALGRTTTIIQDVGAGECHDIFCLLQTLIEQVLAPLVDAITQLLDVLLDLFTGIVGLLLTVVTNLIGLLFDLFGSIIQFVLRLINSLSALVSGFNDTTPIPLPGIPQCQLDPAGNAVCIGLYMIENTVFADEGQLYIPLLLGAISLGLLHWLINTIRREISDLGDKL